MIKIVVIYIIVLFLAFVGFVGLRNTYETEIYQDSESIICQNAYGDVVFMVGDMEKLRLTQSGDFVIDGRFAFKDKVIYDSFREWVVENKGDLRRIR